MLGEGLNALLTGSPAVSVILATRVFRPGATKTSGVWPLQMPEGEPVPAIVYSEIHGEGVMTMDGPDALQFARVQLSCYGKSYADAKRLARAVRLVLEAFTGILTDPDATQVFTMRRIAELDAFAEGPFLFHVPVDFAIAYLDLAVAGGVVLKKAQFTGDGSTTVFNLPSAPTGAVAWFWNGLIQSTPADYSFSGQAITVVQTPAVGDELVAIYS